MSKKNIRYIIEQISPLMHDHGFELETQDNDSCIFYNKMLNDSRITIKNNKKGVFDYQAIMARSFSPMPENKESYSRFMRNVLDISSDNQVNDFIIAFKGYLMESLFPSYEEAYTNPEFIFPSIGDERFFYEKRIEFIARYLKERNECDMETSNIDYLTHYIGLMKRSDLKEVKEKLLIASGGVLHLMGGVSVEVRWDNEVKGCVVTRKKYDYSSNVIRPVVFVYSLWQRYNINEIKQLLYDCCQS